MQRSVAAAERSIASFTHVPFSAFFLFLAKNCLKSRLILQAVCDHFHFGRFTCEHQLIGCQVKPIAAIGSWPMLSFFQFLSSAFSQSIAK